MIKRLTTIFLALVLLSIPALSQISIMPLAVRKIDEARQVCFFTITYKAKSYNWHGNTPVLTGVELVDWLNARKEKIAVDLLNNLYFGANISEFRTTARTELQAFEAWVTAGCKNKVITGMDKNDKPIYGYVMIPRTELRSTHPEWIGLETQIDSATSIDQLKAILKKFIKK